MPLTDERGFWLNAKGEAVHKDMVRVNEQIKTEMVEELLENAKSMSETIAAFKQKANERIESYFSLLLQNYGVDEKAKTKKGNLTLENYSSTAKVELRVSDILSFDEKLQVAKMKIDEYLKEATKDASPEIKTLITKAFEVDKKGNIDAKKIFALKSYEIRDKRWIEAMNIIDESKQIAFTRSYIRFYARESVDADWVLIPLDIAAIKP